MSRAIRYNGIASILIILMFLNLQLIEKSQKTSTNQSTKFHQLQAIFGHQGATIKDIANIQNSLMTTPKNTTPNGSLELLNYSENEVRHSTSWFGSFHDSI